MLVVCDRVDPDLDLVDAVVRLRLAARRLGYDVRLRSAPGRLAGLLDLVGLSDVVPLCSGLGLEPEGQAEEREQVGGVEKGVDPADPAV